VRNPPKDPGEAAREEQGEQRGDDENDAAGDEEARDALEPGRVAEERRNDLRQNAVDDADAEDEDRRDDGRSKEAALQVQGAPVSTSLCRNQMASCSAATSPRAADIVTS
jgi:hypothetical protein